MELLSNQVHAFTATLVIGMAAGCGYDYYRVVRGQFKLRKIGTCFGDVVFWLVTTALVFYLLLLVNWGVVRFYVFVALGLGAMIYYWLFSGMARRLFTLKFYLLHQVWKQTVKVMWFTRQVILFPVRLVVFILSYPFCFLRRLLTQAGHRLRQPLDRLLGRRVAQGIKIARRKVQCLVIWKKRKKD